MQKLLKISACFILILAAGACRKDKPTAIVLPSQSSSSNCKNLVFTSPFNLATDYTPGDQYKWPCFNPDNMDEFIYVKRNSDTPPGSVQLIKCKISSGNEQILLDGVNISGQPQWGKQGWILFSVGAAPPQVIWKIYEDGSGLEAVTPSNLNCFKPRFNAEGDKFVTQSSLFTNLFLPIRSLSGNVVDSLKYIYDSIVAYLQCPFNNDFKNGYYSYVGNNSSLKNKGFCKLTNNQSLEKLNEIHLTKDGGGLVQAMCQNNQSIYYTQYQVGLFRLDKTTHQTELVMENCQTKFIGVDGLSMSSNGKSILYERIRGNATPDGMAAEFRSDIYLYNINTMQEIKLLGQE